jgi:hypothetical protein
MSQESMNIAWLLLKEFAQRFKKVAPVEQDWNIQNETYKLIDPHYPLLRKTLSFKGKKTFDLSIKKNEKPHLIFLFLESFRQKEIGKYSPHFDRLAKEGIYFTEFHSNGTRTSHGSIASLYGVPPTYAPSYLYFYLDIPMIGVPHVLKDYESTLIQSGHLSFCQTCDFFRSHGFTKLFGKNEILKKYPVAKSTSWGVSDEMMFQFAAEHLLSAKGPTFLSLFTITNHHPWRLPGKTRGEFCETFAYTDACLGKFMKDLEPILDNCIFFILADHGQSLGERDGNLLLNRHLYQEIVQIPLLIYAKGRIAEPKKIDVPASQIDLLPTVLDLFHIHEPHHSLGRSLQREGSAPIFFVQPNDDPLIAWRDGNEKYIHHLSTGKGEFYDLSKDPNETVNLEKSFDVLSYLQKLHSLYSEKRFCPKTALESNPLSLSLKGRLDANESHWANMNLVSLNLSHCLLLTDIEIESVLRNIPDLEELLLEGVEDLSGNWKCNNGQYLTSLNLLGCPKLQGDKTARWLASLAQLCRLKFDGSGFCKEDYKILGQTAAQWEYLEIANAHAIDDEAFEWLLQNQCAISYLVLEKSTAKELRALERMPIRYLNLE